MIRVKFKLRTVLWARSPNARMECEHDMHGIGLTRHDPALQRKIADRLRSAPRKHDRWKGGIVHSEIFKWDGVTSAWW